MVPLGTRIVEHSRVHDPVVLETVTFDLVVVQEEGVRIRQVQP